MDSEDAAALCAHIAAENIEKLKARDACVLLEQIGYAWNATAGRWLPRPLGALAQTIRLRSDEDTTPD